MPGRKPGSNASEAADRAWEHAVRLLAGHDRSEQELRKHLAAAGESEATITATLRRLRQRRYVDDQRFALATAERALRRGYGSEYLRARLEQYGIPEPLIDKTVHALYADEMAVARQVLGRRFPEEPRRAAERAKAARFLLRRGFPEAVVFAILDEAC
jgi:regulatory protein